MKAQSMLFKAASGASIAAALILGSSAAAFALPSPAAGDEAGGTVVTLPVPAAPIFTQVSAGGDHTVAITADGELYAWGRGDDGQLGNQANVTSSVPVRVETPIGVSFTQVSAGDNHTVALADDGNAYAWGNNVYGRLGDGLTDNSSVPVRVQAPAGVTFTQVSAGTQHSLAIGDDGNTYGWGSNLNLQVGNGSWADATTPAIVATTAGVNFTQVAAGEIHSLAIANNGDTYAWGGNWNGSLGNGSTANSSTPVLTQSPAGVSFTQVTANARHSAAIGDDGNTYAWGSNEDGQVGNATNSHAYAPSLVHTPAGVQFTSVTAARFHMIATGDDGNLYTWGGNWNGTLGNGANDASNEPVMVQSPAGVSFTQASAGGNHSAAVTADGNVFTWGSNLYGQLGNGANTNSNLPVLTKKDVVVTAVTFDGIAGNDLINDNGTISVATPPHAAGLVDVVLSWTLNGVQQQPVTYSGGFTYEATPTNTDEEPGNAEQEPGNTNEEPGNTEEEPGNTEQEPGNTDEEPGNTNEEPGNTEEEPGNTEQEPGNTEEPGNTDEEPENSALESDSSDPAATTEKVSASTPAVTDSLAITGANNSGFAGLAGAAALIIGAALLTMNFVAKRRTL